MNTRRTYKTLAACAAVAGLLAVMGGAARAQAYHAEADLTNKEVGSNQVLLGNLVADAVRASAKTDLAFVSASAFTEAPVSVAHGGFGLPDVMKTLEYKGDVIAIVKLTGAQIRAALEQSLYQYPGRNVGFLQTSGLTVTFNPSAPGNKRVVGVKIGGSALEAGKTYRVAMPAPLANGSHGYFKFWQKSDIEKTTDVTLEAALTSYLNDHKTITKGENRLVANAR